MGISGLRASYDGMAQMMQILMQGMQETTDLTKGMIAMNVENSIIGEKMAIAQQIIDVYA